MSRIRRLSYAIDSHGRRANSIEQASRLRDAALSIVEDANANASISRRITKKAAFTVVLRSLEKTRSLPFSLREHMAMRELSRYISLAQNDKTESLTLSHTDLLPVSHPRSTREHSMTASALRHAKSRWYSDDPRITDERAKVVLASAFSAEPGSVEHTYYSSILSGLTQGTIPADALIAVGNPFSGGNSSAERSLRARLQRRDRDGQFAFMGGGLSALVRRANGQVFNLLGRPLVDGPDGDDIQMELPDGRIVNIPASKGLFRKATLAKPGKGDGYSKTPAKVSLADKNIINEEDLVFVDSPNGWNKIADNVWSNGTWEVSKSKDGKFSISRDASNGKKEFIQGDFKSWDNVLESLDEYDDKEKNKKANLPKPEAAKEPKKFEFDVPEGGYRVRQGEYDPEGRIDEESTDFTDDPAELAQSQDVRDLISALEQAVLPQGNNANAFGYGALRFNRGDELVPADAIYNALKEAGEDADLELARIYDKGLGSDNNENALLDSRKGAESVGQASPQLEESFKRVTEEGTPDVAPAAVEEPFVEENRDLTPLPPLLEGMSEPELARFMETKDHTPFLPKNEDIEMPEGYNTLNPAPFESWQEVTPDNPSDVLPEGFSDNPVFLSQEVPKSELLQELRRSIEPGNEAPGYGAISLNTEDGDKFTANVPGEAIRDALQLQGVDTNAEIKKISEEGMVGQKEEEAIAELPLDLPVEPKPMNAYERMMAENQAARDAVTKRREELDKAAADRVDEQGRSVPEGWGIEKKNKPYFGPLDKPENHFNVYGRNNFEARVDENGKITLKDNNNLLEAKTYDSWEELQADFDARKQEYAQKSREQIKNFAKSMGFSDEQVNAFDSMTEQEIADFFANPENHTPEYASALDDANTSWAVDLPNNAQKQRWNNFRKNERIAEHAGDFPEEQIKLPPLDEPMPDVERPFAPEPMPDYRAGVFDKDGNRLPLEGEQDLDVKAMLDEEEALADKYQEEEGMDRGDAQAVAEADMKRKYGKTAIEALNELSREDALQILNEREAGVRKSEKKTVSAEVPNDFEVDSIEEVPDGLAEYPKPADVAPAGDTPAPYRLKVKVTDLQPGDVTVGDHFVIEEVGERVPGTTRLKIKGHYPGHVSQDTKQWNDFREIEVIRGVEAPPAGDLPVLSKPKAKDFAGDKEGLAAAQAEYDAALAQATARFVDPTSPSNQPQRTIVRAADVKPGDVTTDPKKGHFVIERTFVDEKTKPGFVSVEGYYPGHVTQRKEWKVDTQIDVLRNVEAPAKGDLPELHRPNKTVNGKWIPDNDPAKNEEWQKQIDEAAARWNAPQDLPIVENNEQTPEAEKDVPNVVAVKRPKAPKKPQLPAFQGDWAALVREANGDWSKLKELLKGKTLVFFDFETTGLKVGDGDEPWQIGAVKVVDGVVVERKNIYMNPGRSIEGTYAAGDEIELDADGKEIKIPHAVDADGNKLTDEFLAKQPDQKAAFEEFLAWAGPDALLGAHNVAFDDMVARHLADKHGVDFRPAGYVDTMVMARDIFKEQEGDNKPPNNKLGGLAEFLDIELNNAHSADADSEATANLFGKLVDKAIELDAGKDLLDVDARNDEYLKQLEAYDAARPKYEEGIADFAAAKALSDGLKGKEVNLDEVVGEAKGVTPVDPEGITLGPVGNEAEQPAETPDVVVLDFTPNAAYPQGKMRLMPRDWILNDENTFLMDREDARLRNLLPGDFMSSKDGNTVWQVVAVRAGEEFMLEPGKVRVYRRNVETGEMSTYTNFHGMRADGVRRAKNPADLNIPEVPVEGEATPYVANKPDMNEALSTKEFSADIMEKIDYPNGAGRIFIKKGEDGKYAMKAVFFDEQGNEAYVVEDNYRTPAGAHAEGRALLDAHVNDLIAAKRDEQAEPAESRPKDVPISRGVIPAGEDNAPELIEVDNLPENVTGNIRISDTGVEKPVFSAEAVLQDKDGDLLGQQTTEHSNKKEAEEEGRSFLIRLIEGIEAQLDEAIAKQRAAGGGDGPSGPSKPSKPSKELSEADIRVLDNNAWVEDNAGALADTPAIEAKVGDFFYNRFFGRYEEIRDIRYIGNVNGVYNRVEFEVFNVYNNQLEMRYFEADSPLRNMRRPGIEDQLTPERVPGGKARGGPRGLVARKPLEERILAKDRPMAGRIDEKAGFFIARNGVALQPGDIVRHKDPVKDAKLGRGVVKLRVGAQVDEGAKARGLVRDGRVIIDELFIQWENEDREYALKQGGVPAKARNLVFQTDDVDGIVLPAFRGGRARQNPGRDPGVAVVPDARPRAAKANPGMPEQIDNNKVQDLNGGNFETNLIKIGDVYEGALVNKDENKVQIVIRTTDKQEAFNKLAEARQIIRTSANGDEAMADIDNLDIVQPAKNIEPDEIKSFNFIDAEGNVNKENVRANAQAMADALEARIFRMPVGDMNRNDIGRAVSVLRRIEIGFDPDRPERLDTTDLESAIRKIKRAAGDEGASYGRDLDKLVDAMRRRVAEAKAEQARILLEGLNKPFANAIPDADNMDAAQLKAAVQEMIDRLPKNGMAYDQNENILASVRHGLESFIKGIDTNEDIAIIANTDGLGIAISNLETLKNRGLDLPEYSQRILDMGQAVMKYKRDNKKDPVKANMPFVDPLAVAEKRIADNVNAIDLASFPNLREKIANIKGAKFEFMQPHLQEIQEFFAKDNAPMASLSPDARQALAEYLATIAHNGSNIGATPEETKANANELGRMLFAIREEKRALNPDRNGIGDILGPLQQIDKGRLMSEARRLAREMQGDDSFQKLIVDGVDTGFFFKSPDLKGINDTYQLIHRETGQVIYMKKEGTKERAKAEQAALELARALGIFGVPTFEWHSSKEDVFFLTSAGDNYNFEKIDSGYDYIMVDDLGKGNNAKLVKKMVLADGVAFGVLDGILLNSDRHSVNFLFGVNKVNNPNNHEQLQVLPIDHGFAGAINGEVRNPNTTPVDHLGSGTGRNGAGIAMALAKSVGAITYKELADLSVQQAIQLLERGEVGKDIDPAMLATILDRLRQFQGIDVSKVADRLGDK